MIPPPPPSGDRPRLPDLTVCACGHVHVRYGPVRLRFDEPGFERWAGTIVGAAREMRIGGALRKH